MRACTPAVDLCSSHNDLISYTLEATRVSIPRGSTFLCASTEGVQRMLYNRGVRSMEDLSYADVPVYRSINLANILNESMYPEELRARATVTSRQGTRFAVGGASGDDNNNNVYVGGVALLDKAPAMACEGWVYYTETVLLP